MNKIKKYLPIFITIFSTSTFRQTSLTFSATFITGLLGAFFYIYAARLLDPAQFGVLTLSISVLTLTVDVSNLGVNTGIVRFTGKYINSEKEKAFQFLRLALLFKFFMSLVSLLASLTIASLVSIYIFKKPELTPYIRLAFIGSASLILFGYATASLQGLQKFKTWSVFQIGNNTFRLVILFVLGISGAIGISQFLYAYTLIPLFFFVWVLFILKINLSNLRFNRSLINEFFHYNKWVAFFNIVSATAARLDTFITARYLSNYELGIYGAANQLVQIMPQLVGALGTVISPKMAGMKTKDELVTYTKKVTLLVLVLALIGIILLPLSFVLIPLLLGEIYAQAIPVFTILFFAMLIFLISVPVHNAIIYYYAEPKLFSKLSLVYLGIVGTLGYYLVQRYGLIGSAVSVLIAQIVNFLIPTIWLVKKLYKS